MLLYVNCAVWIGDSCSWCHVAGNANMGWQQAGDEVWTKGSWQCWKATNSHPRVKWRGAYPGMLLLSVAKWLLSSCHLFSVIHKECVCLLVGIVKLLDSLDVMLWMSPCKSQPNHVKLHFLQQLCRNVRKTRTFIACDNVKWQFTVIWTIKIIWRTIEIIWSSSKMAAGCMAAGWRLTGVIGDRALLLQYGKQDLCVTGVAGWLHIYDHTTPTLPQLFQSKCK